MLRSMNEGADAPLVVGGLSPAPRWLVWLETAVLAAASPLFGLWFQPDDPFFLRSAFFWPVLPVLLAALRYGFVAGLACSASVILGLGLATPLGLAGVRDLPGATCLGLLATGMLSGEFRDLWIRRVHRAEAMAEYRRARLEDFARVHHLLRISHERLEYRLAGKVASLREVLDALKVRLNGVGGTEEPLAALGPAFLQLLSAHCGVQAAAVYRIDRSGVRAAAPEAQLGAFPLPAVDDPLVETALRSQQVASVREAEERSTLIAAVPLVDVRGHLHGVVAIQELHFLALHDDNLRLLAILGGRLGDLIAERIAAALPENRLATVPDAQPFWKALSRALRDLRVHGIPASLVVWRFQGADAQAVLPVLAGQRRGLDAHVVDTDLRGQPSLNVLLPLADKAELDGYLARMTALARATLGRPPAEAGITANAWVLDARETEEEVLALIQGQHPLDDSPDAHFPGAAPGADELDHAVFG